MQGYSDTIKITHFLTDAQRELKAELLGKRATSPKPPEQFWTTEPPGQRDRAVAAFESVSEPPRPLKTSTLKSREDGQSPAHLEILTKQTEIMQQNQAILQQLAEKTALKSSNETKTETKRGKNEERQSDSKRLALQFHSVVEPLMAEIKSLRSEIDRLGAREGPSESKRALRGEALADLGAAKSRLYSQAQEIHKKTRKLLANGTTEALGPSKKDAEDFLKKVEGKVGRLEEKLRVEKEAIAAEVERERERERAKREIIKATQKVDLLGSLKAQEERLGTDFNYQTFFLEIEGLAQQVGKVRADFMADRRAFEVAVPDIKISQKELAQIAARAKPEMDVLELKKRQFGEKYANFVASGRNLGKNSVAFKKFSEGEGPGFRQGEKFWTLKPDYLRSIRSLPSEAAKQIEFRRIRETKHTILIDHDFELERLRKEMANLDGTQPVAEEKSPRRIDFNPRLVGFGGSSHRSPTEKGKAPVYFDVENEEDEVGGGAPGGESQVREKEQRSARPNHLEISKADRSVHSFASPKSRFLDSPKSVRSIVGEEAESQGPRFRQTEQVPIFNFLKKGSAKKPHTNDHRAPVDSLASGAQFQVDSESANEQPAPTRTNNQNYAQDSARRNSGHQTTAEAKAATLPVRLPEPQPDAIGGADLFQALDELRSMASPKKQPAARPDFRNVFGLTEGSSNNESGLQDYLEIYKDELTSRDSLEVSEFSVQQNYSQVMVSQQEIQDIIEAAKQWKHKPQLLKK